MASSSPASTQLSEQLVSLGLDPSALLPRFEAFHGLLIDANSRMNLTRITDWEDFCRKHIQDSLTLLPELQPEAVTVLDVGTGGGLPGIPLWLARPELRITMLDSVGKKLRAVDEMTTALSQRFPELAATRPTTLHTRAEDAGQDPNYRGKFDAVVSRAVATLSVLLELCLPLAKRTGRFIAMKGPAYESETSGLNQIAGILGGRLEQVRELEIAGDQRVLLVFEKRSHTPNTLPRSAGEPKRKPLTEFIEG